MNFLSNALHGSTTMVSLLIGQILVVSSLALMTIWLLVKRARFGPPAGLEFAGAKFVGISSTIVASPATESNVVDQSALVLELEQRCAHLIAENQSFAGIKAEYTALQEKIKFLESKLLEYEILQEEIGTLSMLKLENEKLKKEISKLQEEVEKRVRANRIPPESPSHSKGEPEIEASEIKAEPTLLVQAEAENTEDIEPTAGPAPENTAPHSTALYHEPKVGVIGPTAAVGAGGLDGLLNEIEALTAEVTKDSHTKS